MSVSLQPHLTVAGLALLSFTISWSLLRFMSIESVMLFNHLNLCRPVLPSIFPSIRVFSSESALCIRWPKRWSFSFSISPSNEYSRLISFRMDWFDLAVQGTLKSLLQHHNLKASVFSAQPSLGFPGGSEGKESASNVGDLDWIPVSARYPGEGNGYPLQCSCLENSMDRGTWRATVYGVAKSQPSLWFNSYISM